MQFMMQVNEAFSNLFASRLRSFLAILGILVGTGSVVALLSSSQLATEHALEQFRTLGTNLLAMTLEDEPTATSTGGTSLQLQLADIPKLTKASDQIVLAAPYISLYQELRFEGETFNGTVLAATDELSDIAKIEIERGRFVSYLDRFRFFCVIGAEIAKKAQAMGVEPMYKQIQIGKKYFTIVGIAKPWQPNMFLFADINNGAIIPLLSSYLLGQPAQINEVLFRLIAKPDLPVVQKDLTDAVKMFLPNKRVEFRNPEQIIDIIAKQRVTFTWLLAAIGAISLIVGGIGVMNIMLVSVVERRREIGVRMAIGARQSDILKMFLIESIVLTLFGGLLGILFGVGFSLLLALISKWGFKLFLSPVALGFIVSVIVGIVSGFYPALHASRLDPIETLSAE